MKNLILHIPHSSLNIPSREGFLLTPDEIEKEQALLVDMYTNELFTFDKAVAVKANFSRLFCDVERFADDSSEPMTKHGMGAIYTHTDNGRKMREVTSSLRGRILNEYHYPHHRRLEKAVQKALAQTGNANIVDCHSFSDKPFQRDLDQSPGRPDICIGTDSFHTSQSLLELSETFFCDKGLSVDINRPYSRTIVPLAFLGENRAVQSIMIELNRKLYLEGSTNKKSKGFPALKALVMEYLQLLAS